jgi:hypothetical protein
MEKLRVNGISSPLTLCRWLAVPGQPIIRLASRSNMSRKARMDWADYLRDQAAKYRQLAETAEELSVKEVLLDWAAICEEGSQ